MGSSSISFLPMWEIKKRRDESPFWGLCPAPFLIQDYYARLDVSNTENFKLNKTGEKEIFSALQRLTVGVTTGKEKRG